MSALKRTIFVCLLTCFLKCSVSEEEKNVKTGDDVTLQCQGPRDADITLVKWDKHGLGQYDALDNVFKEKRIFENVQYPSFSGRVELRDREIKDGDVSVILKNVNINDTGTYECRVGYKGKKPQLISTINLTVVTSGDVTAKTGHNVNLECQGPKDADITLVKWDKHGLGQHDVFVFKDNRINENLQHPSFRGRVELRDPQKKDGDVSVILKNVNINDTGKYECYVGYNGSKPQLLNTINLKVVTSGDVTAKTGDNVNLECQGPKDANITLVKWDKHGLGQYDVFVFKEKRIFQNVQHPSFRGRVELRDREIKDGDVSVILKNVTINETGKYECYVAYKGNKPQLINTINLIVKYLGDAAGRSGDEEEKDGGDRDGHVGLILGLSVVVLVVGFIIYRKYKPREQNNQPPAGKAADHELQVLNVTETEGGSTGGGGGGGGTPSSDMS